MSAITLKSKPFPPFQELKPPSEKLLSSSEVTKAILRILQDLLFHTADAKTFPLLLDLKSMISDLKLYRNQETLSIVHTLKHQLDSLFHYTLNHDFPEKKKIASECEHLLAVLEPEKSLSHLQRLMKFHIHARDYSNAIAIIQEMMPKLPKSLQKRVSLAQEIPPHTKPKAKEIRKLCQMALKCSETLPLTPQQVHARTILNTMLTAKTPKMADDSSALAIADLLTESCGNTKLEETLRKQKAKTIADLFLIQFSHATTDIQQAKSALSKLISLLQKPTVHACRHEIYECQQAVFTIRSSLEALISELPLDKRDTIRNALSSWPKKPLSWEYLTSKDTPIAALEKILSELPQGTIKEVTKQALFHLKDLAHHLISSTVPNLKEQIGGIEIDEQLSHDDLFALLRLARLGPQFALLQKITSTTSMPCQFLALSELVENASVAMDAVNALFQALPGYQSGDVLLDIEPIYTPLKHKFSAIKPFFTGKATHASLVCLDQGGLNALEVSNEGFSTSSLTLETALMRVGYRPSLASQLTLQGKDLLIQVHPPMDADTLAAMYSQEIVRQEANGKPQFRQYYTSLYKSFDQLAYALSERARLAHFRAGSILGPLAGIVRLIASAGVHTARALKTSYHTLRHLFLKKPIPPKIIPYASSEFVAEMVTKAQKSVERQLIAFLEEKGVTTPCESIHLFTPLLPHASPPSSVYPTKLRILLKNAGAIPLDPPLSLQLFVQKTPPVGRLSLPSQMDVKKLHTASDALSKALYQASLALESPASLPSALSKDAALEKVQHELTALAPFLERNVHLHDFVRTSSLLLETFIENPFIVSMFVLPLLRKCLIEGPEQGVSAKQACEIAALLLFLNAEKPPFFPKALAKGTDFTSSTQALQSAATLHMKMVAERWKGQSTRFIKTFEKFRSMTLRLAIAQVLLLPDGRVNFGLIPLVQKAFCHDPLHSQEEEIFSVLQRLSTNDALMASFAALPTPKDSSLGQRLINATLTRPYDTPLTSLDVKRAVLGTLLTEWRQGDISSSHVTCLLRQVKDASLQWILDDFSHILAEGFLELEYGGKKIRFYGLERMAPENCDEVHEITNLPDLIREPSVQCALYALRCSDKDLQRAAIASPIHGLFTLRQAFARLSRSHGGNRALERALFVLESPSQPPLWRVWENCIASMTFPPSSVLIPSSANPLQRLPFLKNFVHACISLAFSTGLRKVPMKLLMSLITLKLGIRKLSADPLMTPLSKIRYCYAPSQAPQDSTPYWTLTYETEDGIHIANTEDDVGRFLKDVWLKILHGAGTSSRLIAEISEMMDIPSQHFEHLIPSQQVAIPLPPIIEGFHPSDLTYIKILPSGTSGIKNFLRWAASVRSSIGNSPEATVLASAQFRPLSDQAFYLLPNHSSVIHCSMQEQSEIATKIFLRPASSFPFTCDIFSAELSDILIKHRINAKSVFKEVLQTIEHKYGNYRARSLSAYLETLVTEVEKLAHIPLSETERATLDATILRGFLKDDPSYKTSLIHFAKTNWKVSTEDQAIDLHFCFYLIPRTKQWTIVEAPASGESSPLIRLFPIRTIFAQNVIPWLFQEIGTQYLLFLGNRAHHQLLQQEQAFVNSFGEFEKSVASLPPEARRSLFARYDTLQTASLQKLNPSEASLKKCLIAQSEYNRIERDTIARLHPSISFLRAITLRTRQDVVRFLRDEEGFKEFVRSTIL